MLHPKYEIKIDSNPNENQFDNLVTLLVDLSLDIPSHLFEGKFGRKEKTIKIKKSDPVTIALGYKELVEVYRGFIHTVDTRLSDFSIIGLSSMLKLCNLRVDKFYEKQNAGFMVRDLCKAAGVSTDTIEDGFDFPFYTLDSNKNAFEHVKNLADYCGFETYTTTEDKLMFMKYKIKEKQKLKYGKDIIYLKKLDTIELLSSVKIIGESPASNKGSDTSRWLTKNKTESTASNNKKTSNSNELVIQNKTARTTEMAKNIASATLNKLKSIPLVLVKIVGNPQIKLCDTVKIEECPDETLNGVYQVRRIRHVFDRQMGFISILKCRGADN